MTKHVLDQAELYALGMLDEGQRAEIDAHAATCAECSHALGDAELTVARIIAADAPLATPASLDRRIAARFAARPSGLRWLALAAAIVLLIAAPIAAYWRGGEQAAQRQSPALVALVGSHFAHSPFAPVTSDAPKAKVLYARDGSWLYVVAQTTQSFSVTSEPDGAQLGALRSQGDVSTLFVTGTARVHAVALRDGPRILARARIVR